MKTEEQVVMGGVYLSAAEVAQRLGYGTGDRGRRRVRAEARLGLLPYFRNGRAYNFIWPDIRKAREKRRAV